MEASGLISVREVSSSSELEALKQPWGELVSAMRTRTPFITHEWMTTWWKHFGARGRLRVLVLSRGAEITGIAPLWIGRTGRARGLFRKVGFLGTGFSDYLDVILPEPSTDAVCAVLKHLEAHGSSWDFLDLRELPADSPTARMFAASISRLGGHVEILADSSCPYIPIESDWNTYYTSRMGKRSREHARKRRKRLKDAGNVGIHLIEDPTEDLEPIRKIAAMRESDSYQGENRRAIFKNPRSRKFFEEISSLFAARGWLHIAIIDVDGRTVGYHYGFLYDNRYFHYVTGFDPAFRHLSPGRVLMDKILEQCFERGRREVDFLRGFEAWKSSLTDEVRENQRVRLFRPSLRGRLARLLSARAPGDPSKPR